MMKEEEIEGQLVFFNDILRIEPLGEGCTMVAEGRGQVREQASRPTETDGWTCTMAVKMIRETVKCEPCDDKFLHLSQASLGEPKRK